MTDGSLRGMGTGEEQTVKTFSGDTDLILKRESSIGYSVKTGDLKEGVCRQVRRDKPDWVEEVVSNEGAGYQVGEGNEVKIYFNGQLNSESTDEDRYKRCERDEDCGDCGKCSEEKICVDYDALCQAPTPYCINGSCEPCVREEILVGQKCYACLDDNREFGGVTETDCHQCSNRFFHHGSYRSDCVKDTRSHWTTREECRRCSNRYMPGTDASGSCYFCDGTVSADGTACLPKGE